MGGGGRDPRCFFRVGSLPLLSSEIKMKIAIVTHIYDIAVMPANQLEP